MSQKIQDGYGLWLITGLPGSGKTLRVTTIIEDAIADGRPVYVCNLNGIDIPGVIPWEDPHAWRDLPPNALLVVDEAQRFFRARRGNVEPPESITAMETIRHDGVWIVLTTQQPTYLDKHIRGLVVKHIHHVRNFGHESANVFEFRECYDDVQSPSLRDQAQFSVWLFPKKNYGKYKSAEVHTVKRGLPKKVLIGIVCGVAALGIGAWSVSRMFGINETFAADPKATQAAPAAGSLSPGGGQRVVDERPMTPAEFAQRFLPRFPTMPMSAPAFDELQVAARPQYLCMSSEAGRDADGKWREASVTCLSEQGTRVYLDEVTARDMARNGPAYNPYKPDPASQVQPAQMGPQPQSAGVGAAHADREPGVLIEAPEVGATATWGAAG